MSADPGRPPRVDASMALLADLADHPLEPGYAAAASRRRASPGGWRWSRLWVLAATVALGLALAAAAQTLRQPPTAAGRARATLIGGIEARQAASDALAAQIADLTGQLRALNAAALSGGAPAELLARAERLGAETGAAPLTGPGLTITLDDAAAPDSAGPAGPGSAPTQDLGRVSARDLQQAVNALWAAGAAGVAVNGHRLTATSSIRRAGAAIVVGYRPLTRPYVVTAVGPVGLSERFAAGPGGQALASMTEGFGIVTQRADSASVTVPEAPTLTLRHARAAVAEDSPSPTTSTSSAQGGRR